MPDFLNFFSTYISKENVDKIKSFHFWLHFIYFFLIKECMEITAKVNAFMLPDGEVDPNFQKGGQ